MLKEIKGLKCPHHDLIRDDHHFRYPLFPQHYNLIFFIST